ncbi:MAG: autotransporter-associated beta strand repeat-containing protein [Kiritimatiellae bacterium]|nr:autotransporter-associated beta strand repeat-containing protein [Kiritimatiellia bacterium]
MMKLRFNDTLKKIAVLVLLFTGVVKAENVLTFARTQQCYITTDARITTTAFTVEMWIQQPSFDSENQIFNQDISGNAGRMFLATVNGKPRFQVGGTQLYATTTLTADTWYHLAFVRETDGSGYIYIDGELDKSGTFGTAAIAAANIAIGRLPRISTIGFRGEINDVRVWSTARTQAEIQIAMNTRLTGSEIGLTHYWPLDEGTGTTADNLASTDDGTITGATWTTDPNLPLTSSPEGVWTSSTGGNWSVAGNWLNNIRAQGVNVTGTFTNSPAAAITVTNDMAGLRLGSLFVSGTSSHTFTGNAITFTNDFSSSRIDVFGSSHVIDLPVQTMPNGVVAATSDSGALTFLETISGAGGFAVNPAASGGGTVTVSSANTYTGPTAVGCGTLSVSSLANGGMPSSVGVSSAAPENLTVGPGTLQYTGPDVTIDRGITINSGSEKASMLHISNDLTLSGSVLAQSGAFIKRGPGTLILTGSTNVLGRHNSGSANAVGTYPANGDSPANGFASFTVADGKVVLGVPGQTNFVYSEVVVGGYTTDQAGMETTGELEIRDGYTRVNDFFDIGHHNGDVTNAPTPLQPHVTISGGTLSASRFIMGIGYNVEQNTRPILDICGGTFQVDGEFRFGDQKGSGMLSTINVTSGALIHTHSSIGMGSTRGGDNTLNLYGGLVDDYADIRMGAGGSTSRVNLHGGILRVRNITGSSGSEYLFFNGGTFQPRTTGQTMEDNLLSAVVSTNGAVIDTSLASYTIAQDLLHDTTLGGANDGGLIKLGTNTLVFSSTASTYTGPTLVSNGTLLVTGALPDDNVLTVATGAKLSIGSTVGTTLSAGALTLAGNGMVTLDFAIDGSANDKLSIAGTPVLGSGKMNLVVDNSDSPFTKNGTYAVLTYTGSDPVVSGMTVANPVFGKSYTFAAASGSVTITIASAMSGASVWNVDAGGAWATSGNWTVAPADAAGSQVRFDDAVSSAPVTVTTADETVGEIYINNTESYTLGGSGLTLDNGAEPTEVNVESGTHSITAPLTASGDTLLNLGLTADLNLGAFSGSGTLTAQGDGSLALNAAPQVNALEIDVDTLDLEGSLVITPPVALMRAVTVTPATDASAGLTGILSGEGGLTKTGSSTLTLGAANTYTGITTVKGGTLSVPALADGDAASSIGQSSSDTVNLNLAGGTFHYTGPSTAINRGFTVNPGSGKAALLRIDNDLTVSGLINNTGGAIIKTGPGTLRYTHEHASSIIGADQSSSMGTQAAYPANGDAPVNGFGCLTVAQGKFILGAPGQTNIFNKEVTVGSYTTSEAGQETTGELEFIDGHSIFKSYLDIGYYNGTTLTAPTPLEPTITVSGGTVTAAGIIISFGYNYFGSAYPNSHAVLNIAGGTLTVTGGFRFGDQPGSDMLATINVTSGALIHTSSSIGMGSNRGGDNMLNLYGGLVEDYADLKMGNAGSTSRVNLHGGTLRVRNITASSGSEYLTFNGGTFQPRLAGQTMADNFLSAVVSTNGAVIDTSLASYTIAQKLTHDPLLGGASDGGLVKQGDNTLTLTGANTFTGPIDVQGGLLSAPVLSTNDLSVATDAFFDATSLRATVGDLRGNGTLTNGVIAVTSTLDAGTNGAPAGATMIVENLSLVGDSTFACDWTTNALGEVTNDFVTVTGTLASEGAGFVDLGRTEEAPISIPFHATVMSYDVFSGSFIGWKAVGTGLPVGKAYATIVAAEDGLVTIDISYSGMLILLR